MRPQTLRRARTESVTASDQHLPPTAFRRGFVASTRPIENDATADWVSFSVAPFHVRAHPSLGGALVEDRHCAVLLLGEPVDVTRGTTSAREIAVRLAKTLTAKGATATIRDVAYLGGRFVAILKKRDSIHVLTDTIASIPVFWTRRGSSITLASFAALAAEVGRQEIDPGALGLLAAERAKGVTRTLFLPGSRTAYRDVRPVLANHYLRIDAETRNAKHRRYYPFDDLTLPRTSDAAYRQFSESFATHTRLLCSFTPTAISLTAGLDSRATFAAARPHLGHDSFTWTYFSPSWNRADVWEDLVVANAISTEHGIPHRVIDVNHAANPEFDAAYARSMGPGGQFPSLARAYAGHLAPETTQLQSMAAEVATGFYKNRLPDDPTPERMTALYSGRDFVGVAEVAAAYAEYAEYAEMPAADGTPISWYDLFYWENRIGRWGAVRMQECDLSHRLLLPFSSRHVIESMIGLDLAERVDKQLLSRFVDERMPKQAAIIARRADVPRASATRPAPAVTAPVAAPKKKSVPGDIPMKGFYQDKVAASLDARTQIIDGAVPRESRTLLDIGCNLGYFTAHFARRGLQSVGIEIMPEALNAARERHADLPSLEFRLGAVDPDSIDDLPRTDALLLLSVHHNWVSLYGPAVAGDMLRRLVERTRDVVVFETPSRNSRFGAHPPGFVDNDEESVLAYQRDYLDRYLAGLAEYELVGSAPALGDREPYRWIWRIRPTR